MENKRSVLKTRLTVGAGLAVCFALIGCLLLSGDNYKLIRSVFTNDYTGEQVQDILQNLGWRGYITVSILSMLQVLVAFLPAEPVQVLSGISFGFCIGLFWCAVGVFLGNTVIYVLYKVYGEGIRKYFVKNLHIDFDKAQKSKRLAVFILILYFLPAIPYGMICFLAASVGMKYHRYVWVTFLGSLPSICIGVGLGNLAVMNGWMVSIIIFAVIVVLILIAVANREKLFAAVNAYLDRTGSDSIKVRFNKPYKFAIAAFVARCVLAVKGVRMNLTDKTDGKIKKPCIVLCNHGSFVDFIYAGMLLRKHCPNFVVARLYFYHSMLGWLLKFFGCFPKSMFTLDMESMKNCMTVINNGGVLAMMPEARLSTAGVFEDIQPGTYSFIKKMGVDVYTVVIHGGYLTDPKWGNGIRRGGCVEAELDCLITAEEIKTLSVEEIGERIRGRLCYDEYEWLDAHPEIHYKEKDLAEGLENVLMTCPACGKKYTLCSNGMEITCSACGNVAVMDDRYGFVKGVPYKNSAEWHMAERSKLKEMILSDEDYALTDKVKLCGKSFDGKKMLRDVGEGQCALSRDGLKYTGTMDGKEVELVFPLKKIYRLLFGAGEDFELYDGKEIYYFVPTDKRSAVEWYVASEILYDIVVGA